MLVRAGLLPREQDKRTQVEDQTNLSWEYRAANPVTASERMNVFFSNGDVAFLDSSLCNKPIASSGGTWLRADFTGFKSGCSFSVAGDTAGTYAANGTVRMAGLRRRGPDQVVTIRHLLVDSGAAPAEGIAVPVRSHLAGRGQDVHQRRFTGDQLSDRALLLAPAEGQPRYREGPDGPSRILADASKAADTWVA